MAQLRIRCGDRALGHHREPAWKNAHNLAVWLRKRGLRAARRGEEVLVELAQPQDEQRARDLVARRQHVLEVAACG